MSNGITIEVFTNTGNNYPPVQLVQVEENETPIIVQTPQYFAPVQSVNGKIGFVTITQSDLGLSSGIVNSGDLLNYAKVQDLKNYSGYVNSTNSNIVFTTGAQNINDTKIFTKDINVSGTGNFGEVLISGVNILRTVSSISGNYYPRNNPSGFISSSSNFVTTGGNQIVGGYKNFSNLTVGGYDYGINGGGYTSPVSAFLRVGGYLQFIPLQNNSLSYVLGMNVDPSTTPQHVIYRPIASFISDNNLYKASNPSGFITSSGNNNFYADQYIFSGADVLVSGGSFNSNVRYTVNGTGVVLSGEYINNFYILEATTSQTNMNSSNNNYFNYQGAGYTSNTVGRLRTALDNFSIKKVNLGLQQANAPTNSGVNGTLTFFNQTKNIQSPLISNINTTGDNAYYEWIATNLNIPVSFGDKWAFNFSGFSLGPSNIRAVVDIYCYL
jgi:hypothetical protein